MKPRIVFCLLLVTLFSTTAALPATTPPAAVRLSAASVRQGSAFELVVWARIDRGELRVQFAGRTWPLYRERDRWRTYLGTDPNTASGERSLSIEYLNGEETVELIRRTVTVSRVPFARRRITLSPEVLALLSPERLQEEARRVNLALRILEGIQLWEGAFALPADGRLTSRYGVISIYQGQVWGFHRGVDIAAPEGTPVRAANDGIVRLAGELPVSGNAVLVDHGLGVVTSYLHMSAVDVVPGQQVLKGDQIGRVGSTGVATGPHVHWGLRTNGVHIDPLPWVE